MKEDSSRRLSKTVHVPMGRRGTCWLVGLSRVVSGPAPPASPSQHAHAPAHAPTNAGRLSALTHHTPPTNTRTTGPPSTYQSWSGAVLLVCFWSLPHPIRPFVRKFVLEARTSPWAESDTSAPQALDSFAQLPLMGLAGSAKRRKDLLCRARQKTLQLAFFPPPQPGWTSTRQCVARSLADFGLVHRHGLGCAFPEKTTVMLAGA